MRDKFRQSMGWLHTWSGLILGWLLFAIFFTGTYSYFRSEITYWMQPELHAAVPGGNEAQIAYDYLQKNAPDATSWSITLPSSRSNTLAVSFRNPTPPDQQNVQAAGGGGGRRAMISHFIDTQTGERIIPRETIGGNFLYRFHIELYGMDRLYGRRIVGIATMVMFVAIITGIILHKRIFADFFTFRRKKGTRSWIDAHIFTAVLALPFHLMITYSGLVLLIAMLLPWNSDYRRMTTAAATQQQVEQQTQAPQQGVFDNFGDGDEAAGGERGQGRRQAPAEGYAQGGSGEAPSGERGQGRRQAPAEGYAQDGSGEAPSGERGQGRRQAPAEGYAQDGSGEAPSGERGQGRRQAPAEGQQQEPAAAPAAPAVARVGYPDITKLLADAEERLGAKVQRIGVTNPGQRNMIFEMVSSKPDIIASGRGGGSAATIVYLGERGRYAGYAENQAANFVAATNNILVSLHLARFADTFTRWLFFISGALGTIMVGTGLVIWAHKKSGLINKSIGRKLVDVLNVGGIAGLTAATGILFWANRLLPADLALRSSWERQIFFISWLVLALYPLVRPIKKAWVEELALCAAVYGLLPVLHAFTSSEHFFKALADGNMLLAGFDLTVLGLGILFGYAAWKTAVHQPGAKGGLKSPATEGV